MEYDPIEPAPTKASPSTPTDAASRRAASESKAQVAGRKLPKPDRPGSRNRRRMVLWLAVPLMVALFGTVTGVAVATWIDMPQVESLGEFVPRLVTNLRSVDGEVYRSYSRENRTLIEPGDLPTVVAQAAVAIEDANFYEHGGIDLKGVIRALVKNWQTGRREEGASTITMQMARELFLHRDKTWKRKIEEAFLAVELEQQYSKQQILTLYANMVNQGHGNYGYAAAARNYFGKPLEELTVAEAATIVGIPQRPSDHSPYRRPELVVKRRNEVLRRMLEEDFIDQAQHDAAVAEPLVVVPRRKEARLGPYFAEEVRRHLIETYGADRLYDEGLLVDTTLDTRIQRAAERALHQGLLRLDHRRGWRKPLRTLTDEEMLDVALPSWKGIDELTLDIWYEGVVLESGPRKARVQIADQQFEIGADAIEWTRKKRPNDLLSRGDVAWFRLAAPEDSQGEGDEPVLMLEQEPEMEGAVVVVESATGAIRGLVGGWSYERNEFDRVMQAKRQVGSAFKPFVIGAALENGFTPADTVFDAPAVFPGATGAEEYSPRNYYPRYFGIMTLRRVLAQSANVASVKLQDIVGGEAVIDFAQRAGVSTPLQPFASLALGVIEMSPLELAGSYATLANQGIFVEPYLVEQVRTRDGRVLEAHQPRARKGMEPQIAALLVNMLRGVVQHGTARSVANLPLELAGKTGTTDDYTDAWFAGFTPKYTILSWVGFDKRRSLGRGQTGAEAALPIWSSVIEQGLEDGWIEEGEAFAQPPGLVEVAVELDSGLLPGPTTERTVVETFVEGTEPTVASDFRWNQIMQLPWFLQEPFYLPKEGERMPADVSDWSAVQRAWGQSR